MMKRFIIFLFLALGLASISAQNTSSPYKTGFWKDGAWITTGVGLNVAGLLLIQNKDELTPMELSNLDKNDIWGIDRFAAGNYSSNADELSYIPMYASFATPLLLLIGEDERQNFGQISVMFIETMATTGALFTLSAGLVKKSRPLVYNTSLPEEERTEASAQRSFFAGHTASTAAATFFTAKVFQDFNPDSPAIPYVWIGAAAVPAFVGYLRLEAGKHFLTDNIIGYGVGALCGILIPEIHKIGNENVAVYPAVNKVGETGLTSTGIGVNLIL